MRPVRKITPEEENYRVVELIPGNPRFTTSKCDPVEPEPVGTIVLMAFRVTGYDPDCDGSLMARLAHIDKDGKESGWNPTSIGIYPEADLVVTAEEWRAMFDERASTRLTPAEREVLRELVDVVPRGADDFGQPRIVTNAQVHKLMVAARNAVAIIARLLGEGEHAD